MTGPDGEKSHGWWRFLVFDKPHSLEFEDGFGDEAGVPNPHMPTIHTRVELQETADGTRITVTSRLAIVEHIYQLMTIGMTEAMGHGCITSEPTPLC
jgi:uncharacterized protein YndB with AHSA1/START domain